MKWSSGHCKSSQGSGPSTDRKSEMLIANLWRVSKQWIQPTWRSLWWALAHLIYPKQATKAITRGSATRKVERRRNPWTWALDFSPWLKQPVIWQLALTTTNNIFKRRQCRASKSTMLMQINITSISNNSMFRTGSVEIPRLLATLQSVWPLYKVLSRWRRGRGCPKYRAPSKKHNSKPGSGILISLMATVTINRALSWVCQPRWAMSRTLWLCKLSSFQTMRWSTRGESRSWPSRPQTPPLRALSSSRLTVEDTIECKSRVRVGRARAPI